MLHNRSPSSYPQHIPLPQIIIKQLQIEKQQLSRIKQQQQTISSIDENIKKKNQQIQYLKSQLQKYQPYHQKYHQLSYQYNDKLNKLAQKQKQSSLLLKQVQDLIQQNDFLQSKLHTCDQQRSHLIKQQRQIQVISYQQKRVNNQIQQTFNLYQQECKKKQMGLLKDIQKAYKQITELNKRIDDYEMKMFENQELKKKLSNKIHEQNSVNESIKQQKKLAQSNKELESLTHRNLTQLKHENQQLKYLLSVKEDQLIKYKILNQQLSIEFDKSVSKICDFERQLTKYRQQNHELQKMLNLFVDKEKYEKMHLRQLQKVNARKNQSYFNQQDSHQKSDDSNEKNINQKLDTDEINENY